MAQTFASGNHLAGSSVAGTAVPITLVIWINTLLGQGRKFISLANSSDTANAFANGLDVSGTISNEIAAYTTATAGSNQALSSAALPASAWHHAATVFASSSSRAAYLDGVNKGTASGNFTPSGINQTIISGRSGDFLFGITGQAAHAAAWSRALSDTEVAYLGSGGNPRAIKSVVSYWKIASGASPVPDEIGTNNLTVTGASAGTSDPSLQTFMTNGPVGALAYTVGSAIASINVAGLFDSVSSPYTVTLVQLGTPTQPTTTSSGLTATREIVVGSNAAFSAGDYCKVTSGGTPTRVLGLGGTTIILVADDQTYSTSSQVFRFAVSPLTVAGLSISSGTFSGTPTAAATNSLCFFRATCNAVGTLMADSDVFTITTTGGGGGSGLLMPAGIFSGGFIGG